MMREPRVLPSSPGLRPSSAWGLAAFLTVSPTPLHDFAWGALSLGT